VGRDGCRFKEWTWEFARLRDRVACSAAIGLTSRVMQGNQLTISAAFTVGQSLPTF
jgi:hypothetical protein